MKAKETIYRGICFRSRLESKWALFLDRAGLSFRYEMENYNTRHGYYCPDFYLPEANLWLEVKPFANGRALPEEIEKLEDVVNQAWVPGIIVCGFPPKLNVYVFLPSASHVLFGFDQLLGCLEELEALSLEIMFLSAESQARNLSCVNLSAPGVMESFGMSIGVVDRYKYHERIQKKGLPVDSRVADFENSRRETDRMKDKLLSASGYLHGRIKFALQEAAS